MPLARHYCRIDRPADFVWEIVRDTPIEDWHRNVKSSGRSKDGSILRVDNVGVLEGRPIEYSTFYRVGDCDDALRCIQFHGFAAQGPYDFVRPLGGVTMTHEVLDLGEFSVFMYIQDGLGDSRSALGQYMCEGATAGLKEYCEQR
jgi:hypothetical protein